MRISTGTFLPRQHGKSMMDQLCRHFGVMRVVMDSDYRRMSRGELMEEVLLGHSVETFDMGNYAIKVLIKEKSAYIIELI